MTTLKDILFCLCLFIIGVLAAQAWQEARHTSIIDQAVKSGRLNTPQGIYYLSPAPTSDEISQLRADVEWLNRQLNKRRRKG